MALIVKKCLNLRFQPIQKTWQAAISFFRETFTVACWSTITSDSNFMFSFQKTIQTTISFKALLKFTFLHLIVLTIVWRVQPSPSRPYRFDIIRFHVKFLYKSFLQRVFTSLTKKTRVALVIELNHTPHSTSWRQPCNTCSTYDILK